MEIDLIVLCYNFEEFIGQNINSLLKLKLPCKTNLIISDDKSQDRSVLIIKKNQHLLEKKFNKVLINVNKINYGVKKNLELAVKNFSKNEIIILQSGDDLINANRVKHTLNAFKVDKKILSVSSNFNRINEQEKIIDKKSFSKKYNVTTGLNDFYKTPFVGATTSHKKEVFSVLNHLKDDVIDLDMVLKIYALVHGKVCYIDLPLINFRQRNESLSILNYLKKYTLKSFSVKQKKWLDDKIYIFSTLFNIYRDSTLNEIKIDLELIKKNLSSSIIIRIFKSFLLKNKNLAVHMFPELRFLVFKIKRFKSRLRFS